MNTTDSTSLKSFKDKFSLFLRLIDQNKKVLGVMSDMEEKAHGEYLFDINYILAGLNEIRGGVTDIIDCMVALGGDKYGVLYERYDEIDAVIESVLPGRRPVMEDDFTVPFDKLNRKRVFSVGHKNAQLGEMKSRLKIPVPEGFAITARAYKHFVDVNKLQVRISRRIDALNFKSFEDLVRVSREIRDLITGAAVPDDLADEIIAAYRDLAGRAPTGRISMRSSAIGEDTLFSFAGQYASYLNVTENEIIDRYREILASKFTPQAIYYFLSHALSEAELVMSVGCVSMIDAASSGVVYTRDPINPDDETVIIHSIFGLGKYLVNGHLTPDVFRVSRSNFEITSRELAEKPVKLVIHPLGGTMEKEIPPDLQAEPSLADDLIKTLTTYAVRLEEHYLGPQDIEWAVDESGRLYFLQTRPLQIIKAAAKPVEHDVSSYKHILSGGTTVCPGAGCGPVHHVASVDDLQEVPGGAVVVAQTPFPGLVTAMGKVHALLARVGGLASHMATIAREYHLPTLVGLQDLNKLREGQLVTVDATGGSVYEGLHGELVEARQPDYDLFEDSRIHKALDRVLDLISPLRLIHPADEDFLAENCMTFHDITRFTHQKAMDEMFKSSRDMREVGSISHVFKSTLPVEMYIIYLDQGESGAEKQREITEKDIADTPLHYFWEGIKKEGWPRRFVQVSSAHVTGSNHVNNGRFEFSEKSFVVLSREYMMLSIHMGYHFTTIEAMCAGEPAKNYIQLQYKDGGASLDRRIRRIKLLSDILKKLGFAQHRRSDYLHSTISFQSLDEMQRNLYLLGRLTIMTKQLDMALSSDAVSEWYTGDFIKKLGLGGDGRGEENA